MSNFYGLFLVITIVLDRLSIHKLVCRQLPPGPFSFVYKEDVTSTHVDVQIA